MIALDASVLIGHLTPHDAHHAAATEILRNAAHGSMIVHPLTLAEVLVGGVRVGRGQAMRNDLEAVGIRVVAPDAGEPLRLAELRVSTGLKLPDCCVLDVALHSASSLATFDDALAAGARQRGVHLLP